MRNINKGEVISNNKNLKDIVRGIFSNNSREFAMLVFIIVISIGIQSINHSFLTQENLNDMITNTAILAILAIGMMLVLITGGIDLSIGATLALSGMTVALIVSKFPNISPVLAILLGIVVGSICGLIVGILISKLGILPIIATLGMMNIFRGLTYMISGGRWVSAYQMSDKFKGIATGKMLGINNLIAIAIIIYIATYYFINHTRTGRQIYAVGSNEEAAVIRGINRDKILIIVYTIMGSLSGLAGVLWVSKFASAQGDTAMGYEMSVIAACVLGGVSVAGGVGKIQGLLLGALLLGILNNALPLINVSTFWQQAIQGCIILFAVISNVVIKRHLDKKNLMRREI